MSDDTVEGKTGLPAAKLSLRNAGRVEIAEGYQVFHPESPYPFNDAKPFFRVDAYRLRHAKYDGSMTGEIVREVFERGDAVGVLLYNRDTRKVIVVEQFRLPTLDVEIGHLKPCDGWVIETIAGMAKPGESPLEAAERETYEETGYKIEKPHLIAEYFSSPGGSSEKVYLFYKEVQNSDRTGPSGGTPDEDIKIVEYDIEELALKCRKREFVDPKLIIATYYLGAHLGLRIDTLQRLDDGEHHEKFVWRGDPSFEIGIKTGDILGVKDVDVWLNPENRYLMPARIIDEGLSASIRWGVARKFSNDTVAADTIFDDLRSKLGGRFEARDYEIVETDPGDLRRRNNVRRLLHLPIAEPSGENKARKGVTVKQDRIAPYVLRALRQVQTSEAGPGRMLARWRDRIHGYHDPCASILIPLIGSGQGGLSTHFSIIEILNGIHKFLSESNRNTLTLRRFYLLAHHDRDCEDCVRELGRHPHFKQA